MNACKRTQALLFESADGRTGPSVQSELDAHLAVCRHCKQVFVTWTDSLPRLRGLPVEEPSAVTVRRMENEVMRQMERVPAPEHRSLRPLCFAVAAGILVAAGVGAMALRPVQAPLARIEALWGHVTLSGVAMSAGAAIAAGGTLEISDEGEASFVVGRESQVRLQGPGRLRLVGTARQPKLRLDSGRLSVEIAHRRVEETFAVATAHGHVEVRGTRFVVGYGVHGSYVHVEQGEVAAYRAGVAEPFAVKTGETFELVAPPEVPPLPVEARGTDAEPARCSPTNCAGAALQARKAMRRGTPARAVELVDEILDKTTGCPPVVRCLDELGYLRAEGLSRAGRTEAAVAAYRSLNRPGATRAMRQNALYAAGLLERKLGRLPDARQSFEQALAASPDGGLAEESLAALLELAPAGAPEARAAAERYLARYPRGMAAARARRILSEAPRTR